MVMNVTNLGRSGLSDWIVQRFSAIILAAYSLCILASFVMNPDMDFETWSSIFDNNAMRLFSLITLLALCAHAWIGMWTISTDYMTSLQLGKSATFFRIMFQAGCVLLIAVYLLWGIQIFWGN
ncbi:MAG TPA: succinate dehydrogenase, hydrophobic membrane anchor protein [Gammaproteobacteria bacterium]|nr:succinate dehydrogenase, hydrophobic membrane anchor protein [Gammaproteobacteria bacterium]HAS48490.1 succinate dehydrogenase, hydrophobic membrane anchor protein [Gammaproteobacteria bacterium]